MGSNKISIDALYMELGKLNRSLIVNVNRSACLHDSETIFSLPVLIWCLGNDWFRIKVRGTNNSMSGYGMSVMVIVPKFS